MENGIIDITGNKYNYLTVLSYAYSKTINHKTRTRTYWNCQCDCGNIVVLRKDAFAYSSSKTKSCGCWKKQESRVRLRDNKTGQYINKK